MNQIELECLNHMKGELISFSGYGDLYRVYIKGTHRSHLVVAENKPEFSKMLMKGAYYNKLVKELSHNNDMSIESVIKTANYVTAYENGYVTALAPKRWVKIECSPGVLTSTSSDEKPTQSNPLADEIFKSFENLQSDLVTQGLNVHQEFIDLVAKQKERDLMVNGEWIKTGPLGGVFSSFDLQEHGRAKRFKTVTKYIIYSKEGNFFGAYRVIPSNLIPAGAQVFPIEVKVPCE